MKVRKGLLVTQAGVLCSTLKGDRLGNETMEKAGLNSFRLRKCHPSLLSLASGPRQSNSTHGDYCPTVKMRAQLMKLGVTGDQIGSSSITPGLHPHFINVPNLNSPDYSP